MTEMKKFDVAFKFTVTGIKSIKAFDKADAGETFKQDLIDEIELELGEGAILDSLSAAIHEHSPESLKIEFADMAARKALGMITASAGVQPYSDTLLEAEKTPKVTPESTPEPARTKYPSGMGNNEHRCGAY